MFDPAIDSAHEWNDRQARLQDRDEAAKKTITDAMDGTEAQRDEMLAKLKVTLEEYAGEYDADSEKLAEVYYTDIINEWENPEY